MTFEYLISNSERKSDNLTYPIEIVADALAEAGSSQEEFAWLAEVLKGGLPGNDIAHNIGLLERIEFSPINAVDPRIGQHITEALDLLRTKRRADIDGTTNDLNAFIATRPGVFVVSETGGSIVSLLFIERGGEAVAVEVDTTLGPVVVEGGVQVHVDVTKLSPEDRASIGRYERRYEL